MAQSPEAHERWYEANSEKLKARSRAWYAANKERARSKSRRYAAAHPDKIRECQRNWREANPANILLARARHRAKKNGLPFDLTASDMVIPTRCPVLGIQFVMTGRQQDASPSVDRIDNRKGYVKGNVVVISWRANRLKSDATLQELALIASYFGGMSEHESSVHLPAEFRGDQSRV